MNKDWIDRIKKLEINPPGTIWERIGGLLDKEMPGNDFADRLYRYEVPPPQTAWNKIQRSFEEANQPGEHTGKGKKAGSVFRYAIAATLLAFVVFGALKLIIRTPNATVIAANREPAKTNNTAAGKKATDAPPEVKIQTGEEKDNEALEASKHTFARLGLPLRRLNNRTGFSLYSLPAQLDNVSADGLENSEPELQYSHRAAVTDLNDKKDAERYLMFRDNDGSFIRISRKLTSLLCCVTGEQQDEGCTGQLKQWREKIAASSFIPSPDNFMDILDLVKSLQDNRN
jgi:hypothetical protein